MNRSGYHCLVLIVVATVTMLLSGCPINPKRVLLIGDSITYAAAGDISRVGNFVGDTGPDHRMTFAIIANPGIGARTTFGTPSDPDEYWSGLIASAIQPAAFDAVIVELGFNDCAFLNDAGDYQSDIARIVGAITSADPDVPIFWLTMPQHPRLPDCASTISGDLRQMIAAGTYPNLMTFDYGTWADGHPECFSDGVHPRETWNIDPSSGGSPMPADYCEGLSRYAGWLKAQLDDHFGPKAIL